MSSPEENLKDFIFHHRIKIVDENKRAQKISLIHNQYFKFKEDYNKFLQETLSFETEKLYTVEISESELQRVADFEAQVFNNMRKSGHYNLFETMMQQKENEKLLREKYSAVQKAYEHYSLVLKMAQSGEYGKEE
jgi:hypothetical protein